MRSLTEKQTVSPSSPSFALGALGDLSRLFFIALTLLAASGCWWNQSTSHLAKGEEYKSGQEKYDTFFASVTELRGKTNDAKGESDLRKQVAEAVGLPASAKLEDTLDAAKTRSNELKKDGGRFFVVVAPEPKLIVKKGVEENKDATAFAKTIEDAIKQGIQRGDELDGLAREAANLEETLSSLEKELDASFADTSTKDQVKLELDAARELLENSRLRAGSESGQALRFVVLLASAVDSGAAAELLAMEAGGSTKKPAKPIPRGKPGKPVKPRPKNDFDP
ncbi:MAG: hypothetical protein HOW73_13315 [Polyangiaceae bacterium]|nr:hypothetical protein [Polyangiaceae bacterium]